MRVLGEKSVTGMDRIDVTHFSSAHDSIDLQITVRAWRRANTDRFVRQLDMQRIDVRFRINRERANPKFLASADHPQGDFAAIGDKDFFEHQA
jgi:hypothetical protein